MLGAVFFLAYLQTKQYQTIKSWICLAIFTVAFFIVIAKLVLIFVHTTDNLEYLGIFRKQENPEAIFFWTFFNDLVQMVLSLALGAFFLPRWIARVFNRKKGDDKSTEEGDQEGTDNTDEETPSSQA